MQLRRIRWRLLDGPQRLAEACLEGALDGHHLARRLHLRPEPAIRVRELVERPAGNLDDAVVERGLERGACLAGDRVGDLVEAAAHGDLGGDPGDRIARRLRGEGGGARDARVHLDDVVLVRIGRKGELHVASAGDVERADDAQRGAAQLLVLAIGEGLRRRDHHRVAGVHAHRVEVLHVAHGDAGAGGIAHHLVLDLPPAGHGALDEHLADRRRGEPSRHGLEEAILGFAEAASGAAERERGPHHEWETLAILECASFGQCRHRLGDGSRLTDGDEQLLEALTVLRRADRGQRRAEHADAVALEHAGVIERGGEVETRLAAERGEQTVGSLGGDDALDHVDGERLDVHRVGRAVVGHDGGGIAVDQHDAHALFAQRLACLRARVVELRGLPDDDRTAADDEHALRTTTHCS